MTGEYKYIMIRNAVDPEFFREDCLGYTDSLLEAGTYTLEEVRAIGAKVVNAHDYSSKESIKAYYLAISYSELSKLILKGV